MRLIETTERRSGRAGGLPNGDPAGRVSSRSFTHRSGRDVGVQGLCPSRYTAADFISVLRRGDGIGQALSGRDPLVHLYTRWYRSALQSKALYLFRVILFLKFALISDSGSAYNLQNLRSK